LTDLQNWLQTENGKQKSENRQTAAFIELLPQLKNADYHNLVQFRYYGRDMVRVRQKAKQIFSNIAFIVL
jgi:hypothetical protein